jgi:hypothetical protein
LYDHNAKEKDAPFEPVTSEEKDAPLEPVTSEEEDDDGGKFKSGAFDTLLR